MCLYINEIKTMKITRNTENIKELFKNPIKKIKKNIYCKLKNYKSSK